MTLEEKVVEYLMKNPEDLRSAEPPRPKTAKEAKAAYRVACGIASVSNARLYMAIAVLQRHGLIDEWRAGDDELRRNILGLEGNPGGDVQ